MVYTLSVFNTGQITLPKKWRSKFRTKKFIAKEVEGGLLIKPLLDETDDKDIVYYEDKNGFGIYCDKGLPVDALISKIKELNGQD